MGAFTEQELAYLEAQPLMRFRISPEVIWSWNINDPAEGIPTMERRDVS